MHHARLRAALLLGAVTLASACARHQSADAATTVAGERRFADSAAAAVPAPRARTPEPELTPASGPPAARGGRAGQCPMALSGATLTTLPTLGGTAFVFTTTRESARDELRQRVLALRDAYVGAVPAPADAAGLEAGKQIEVHADYLDEPNGARLEIRAIRSSDAEELRRSLRADAAAMQDAQQCPMLESGVGVDSTP